MDLDNKSIEKYLQNKYKSKISNINSITIPNNPSVSSLIEIIIIIISINICLYYKKILENISDHYLIIKSLYILNK